MELLVIVVVCLGLACLWGIHQHQERRIAQRGYRAYLASSRWKKKREACLRRFGYRCAVCNSPYRLEVHHRTYKHLYNERPGDLTCLCRACHEAAPRSDGLYKG